MNHEVLDLAVAHAQAVAQPWQRVRRVAHGLHAAGHDDLGIAQPHRLRRQHHGLQAGAADLVDRECADRVGEPGLEGRLPRRRLAQAGRDDVAENAFVDLRGIQPGARDRLAHREGAQVGRRERLEHAQELARGRTRGAEDDGITHGSAHARLRCSTTSERTSAGPSSCCTRARIERA